MRELAVAYLREVYSPGAVMAARDRLRDNQGEASKWAKEVQRLRSLLEDLEGYLAEEPGTELANVIARDAEALYSSIEAAEAKLASARRKIRDVSRFLTQAERAESFIR